MEEAPPGHTLMLVGLHRKRKLDYSHLWVAETVPEFNTLNSLFSKERDIS